MSPQRPPSDDPLQQWIDRHPKFSLFVIIGTAVGTFIFMHLRHQAAEDRKLAEVYRQEQIAREQRALADRLSQMPRARLVRPHEDQPPQTQTLTPADQQALIPSDSFWRDVASELHRKGYR